MIHNNTLVLIDGYAHIYRSFYAIRGLTNKQGQPTNALFGMARFSLMLDEKVPHEFGALAMDKGRCTHRLELLPEYKANRPSMPEELRSQIPMILDWMQAMGWPLLQEEGREADDLIAAAVAAREGRETVIASHDKDLAQLVGEHVTLLLPGAKGNWQSLGPEEVRAKFGVGPEGIVDYLALLGDSSDNIPGVAGVGAKTAAALLQQFGSIDAMLEHPDQIARRTLRDKIAPAGALLERNRKLVGLDAELPEGWKGIEGLRRRDPDWDRLLKIAADNGFKTIVASLEAKLDEFRNPTLF